MDIHEVRSLKAQLEVELYALLNDFQKKTKVRVQSVNLSFIDGTTISGPIQRVITNVSVEVRV